ncbi:MAG: YkgJ family cysteine cluster protein, partial [Phycisphaerae bacterium]
MNLTVNQPSVSTQRYDCHGCTNCCRDLVVQLTSDDRTRIDGGGWARRLKVEPYVRLGRMTVLNHRPTGGCVFLTDQGQCLIHAEQGASAKPLACRLYPFTFQPEADALRVGYRFDCPSVARNDGSPLPKHRRLLERLAQSKFPHGFHPRAADRWELIKDYPLAGTTVDRLIDRMDRWLADRGQPFQLRLLGLYSLTQTLGAARLKRFDDARLIELVTLLSSDLAGTAHELSERSIEPPTRRQSRLFSQAIFAHCEHVTFQQARSPFLKALAIRWDQLKRSRRLASRIGEI